MVGGYRINYTWREEPFKGTGREGAGLERVTIMGHVVNTLIFKYIISIFKSSIISLNKIHKSAKPGYLI